MKIYEWSACSLKHLVLAAVCINFGLCVSVASAAVGRTAGNFEVTLGGEATYTIPIEVPPGTNKMTPQLAIRYGHRSSSSLLGVGWSIAGLSVMHRCQHTIAQDAQTKRISYNPDAKYCLDGNKLRLETGTYGQNGAVYRTELETFARITSIGTAGCGPSYFTVEHRSGLIYEYGSNGQQAYGMTTECGGTVTVGEWPLSKIRDRQGNQITFLYQFDPPTTGAYRIATVQYTENLTQGLAAAYQVSFLYENKPVNEVDLEFLAGTQIKEIKRLDKIEVRYNNEVVRFYDLAFEAALSNAGNSRLASVTECSTSTSDCLSPTTFTYQNGSPGLGAEGTIASGLGADIIYVLADITGDGKSDVVFAESGQTGQTKYAIAQAGGGFGAPQTANAPPWPGYVLDYNNDGRTDMLTHSDIGGLQYWHVTLGSDSGFSNTINTGVIAYVDADPYSNLLAPLDAKCADINGDGWDDIFFTVRNQLVTDYRVHYREPNATFATSSTSLYGELDPEGLKPGASSITGRWETAARDIDGDGAKDIFVEGVYSQIMFSNGEFLLVTYNDVIGNAGQMGDVNGDGKADVIWIANGNTVAIGYSIGNGFLTPVAGPSLAGFSSQFEVMDWNGDGKDDILLYHLTTGTTWVAYSFGNSFGTPINTLVSIAGRADVNGDGLDDAVYRVGSDLRYRLHTGIKPDLLASVTDGYGNAATVSYTTLALGTHYSKTYLASNSNYQGPLSIVASVNRSNGIGATYSVGYYYRGMLQTWYGRGLTSFAQVRATDSRTNTPEDTHMIRGFPHDGLVQEFTRYQPDGTTRMLWETAYFYTKDYGTGNEMRRFPYEAGRNRTYYHVGGPSNGLSQLSVSRSGDPFVDATSGVRKRTSIIYSEPASGGGLFGGRWWKEEVWISDLQHDTANWCLGTPNTVQLIRSENSGTPTITRTTSSTWNTALCRPSQVVEEPGNATRQITVDIGYDGFGNVSSQTVTGKTSAGAAMAARTTSISWGTTGQFPQTETNALSQATQRAWNFGLGVQTSLTDPNGIAVSWQHDNFGRLTRENRPDGTYTLYSLNSCAPGNCGWTMGHHTRVATQYTTGGAQINSQLTLLDAEDKVVEQTSIGLTGGQNTVLRLYDSLGRVAQETLPYICCSNPAYWQTFSYDLLNRLTSVTRPTSDSDPTPQATTTYYEGLTTRTVDPLGKQSTHVFNAAGQLVRSIDHDGHYQNFTYEAFGNLASVTDSAGNTHQTNTYDFRGFRTASTDANLGSWIFNFNSLGEMTSWTDAKAQNFTATFDALGRPLTEVMPEGTGSITSTWTWGTNAALKEIGQLKQQQISGTGLTTYREVFSFDSVGRQNQIQFVEGANNYYVNTSYDGATGFIDAVEYPISTSNYRLKLKYDYQNGHLLRVRDFAVPTTVFWQANAATGRNQITSETLGNGVVTARSFDAVTGWLDSIQSGVGGGATVQNLGYLWDKAGHLIQRQDNNQGLTENFYYDNLYRIDYTTRNSATNLDVSYNANGNIATKTGVGTYTYDPTKIHAVASVNTGTATWSFSYDGNGNMTNRNGTEMLWFANNLPKRIRKTPSSTTDSSEFQYGPSGMRWRHAYRNGTALYTHVYVGNLLEKVTQGTNVEWKHYIHANGSPVAVYERHSSGTNTMYYLLGDHLGSTQIVGNSTGGVFVNESFDAFGQRRGNNWTGVPTATEINNINTSTRRGFTNHEHLDSTSLIHMNGRVYDPLLGRFASANPVIDGEAFTQGWNRYAYVYNSPASFSDPSGFDCDNPTADDPCVEVTVTAERRILLLANLGRIGESLGDPCHSFWFDAAKCRGEVDLPELLDKLPESTLNLVNQLKSWSCKAGNFLAEGAELLGDSSGKVILTGLGVAGVGLVTAQPEIVAPGLALAAAGGTGSIGAGVLQFGAGVLQGAGTGNFNNAGYAALSLATGFTLARGIVGPATRGYRSVSQRASDAFRNGTSTVAGGVNDLYSTLIQSASPQQVYCGGK